MSDGQECQQCRRSFRRCECGREELRERRLQMDSTAMHDVWHWVDGDESALDLITQPILISAYKLQELLSTEKCSNCGKRVHPDGVDEVGFCDYCAING